MVKCGIFSTMGDLIYGDIGADCRTLATKLTSGSVALYVSFENGKTILGTSLDVVKPNTRVHTILCFEEMPWTNNKPEALTETQVFEFFQRVNDTISKLGYSVSIAESEIYYWYFLNGITNNTNDKKIPSSTIPSNVVTHTIGRMLYNKPVICTSNTPEKTTEYLTSLFKTVQPILKQGYSFTVSKFILRDIDVTIMIGNSSYSHADVDIDTRAVSQKAESTKYYSESGTQYYTLIKANGANKQKLASLASKAELSTWAIKQSMAKFKKGKSARSNVEEYTKFLNAESIPCDPELLKITDPVSSSKSRNKNNKRKNTSQSNNIIENKNNCVNNGEKTTDDIPVEKFFLFAWLDKCLYKVKQSRQDKRRSKQETKQANKDAKISKKNEKSKGHKEKKQVESNNKTTKSSKKTAAQDVVVDTHSNEKINSSKNTDKEKSTAKKKSSKKNKKTKKSKNKKPKKERSKKSKLKWVLLILVVLVIIASLMGFAVMNKQFISETFPPQVSDVIDRIDSGITNIAQSISELGEKIMSSTIPMAKNLGILLLSLFGATDNYETTVVSNFSSMTDDKPKTFDTNETENVTPYVLTNTSLMDVQDDANMTHVNQTAINQTNTSPRLIV